MHFIIINVNLMGCLLAEFSASTNASTQGVLKKLNRYEFALNFAKQPLVSNFYVYSIFGYL